MRKAYGMEQCGGKAQEEQDGDAESGFMVGVDYEKET